MKPFQVAFLSFQNISSSSSYELAEIDHRSCLLSRGWIRSTLQGGGFKGLKGFKGLGVLREESLEALEGGLQRLRRASRA